MYKQKVACAKLCQNLNCVKTNGPHSASVRFPRNRPALSSIFPSPLTTTAATGDWPAGHPDSQPASQPRASQGTSRTVQQQHSAFACFASNASLLFADDESKLVRGKIRLLCVCCLLLLLLLLFTFCISKQIVKRFRKRPKTTTTLTSSAII